MLHSGNRGVTVEFWDTPSTISDYDTAAAATEAPTTVEHYDNTRFCSDDLATHWSRMTGIFVIPADGFYQFSLRVKTGGALYVNGVNVLSLYIYIYKCLFCEYSEGTGVQLALFHLSLTTSFFPLFHKEE